MMGLNYLLVVVVVVVPNVLTRRLERSDIVGGHEVQPHSLPYQVSLQVQPGFVTRSDSQRDRHISTELSNYMSNLGPGQLRVGWQSEEHIN